MEASPLFYRRQTTDMEHSAALLQGRSKLVSCEWATDSSLSLGCSYNAAVSRSFGRQV
jgi:hypothetical protein